jgi:DNA-binding NarL/FixJ family response regulator
MNDNTKTKPIKALIAEDTESLCNYYTQILDTDPEITVVSSVYDGPSAVKAALELKPDVILMDIEMDTRDSGLLATKEILSKLPDTKIIILTVSKEDEMVSSAFTLGACDYMLKNYSPDEIIKGVKDAFIGQSPIRPEIAPKLRSEFQRVKQYETSFLYVLNMLTVLTSTEIDILYLLSQNYTRADICRARCVEMSTVKTQIHNILQKLGKKNISEVLIPIQNQDIWDLVLKTKKMNDPD